jgi:hypothetical protein
VGSVARHLLFRKRGNMTLDLLLNGYGKIQSQYSLIIWIIMLFHKSILTRKDSSPRFKSGGKERLRNEGITNYE